MNEGYHVAVGAEFAEVVFVVNVVECALGRGGPQRPDDPTAVAIVGFGPGGVVRRG